jgi:hypothetical protein
MTPEQMKELAARLRKESMALKESTTATFHEHCADLDAAADLIRQMAENEPVAWRVECRWTDRSKGGDWRLYATYNSLVAAQTSDQKFAGPGDIEVRIVPLYAAPPAPQPARELPTLPPPGDGNYDGREFSHVQMRDYARAALAAHGIRSEE